MWLLNSIGRLGSRCMFRSVCRHVEINKDFFKDFDLVALFHTAQVERWANFDIGGLFLFVRLFFSLPRFLVVESYFLCKFWMGL